MSFQTYKPSCGMVVCVSGGEYVSTADYQALQQVAERLAENLASKVPDKNCACHISPPCFDCTDHGVAREALADFQNLQKEGEPNGS